MTYILGIFLAEQSDHLTQSLDVIVNKYGRNFLYHIVHSTNDLFHSLSPCSSIYCLENTVTTLALSSSVISGTSLWPFIACYHITHYGGYKKTDSARVLQSVIYSMCLIGLKWGKTAGTFPLFSLVLPVLRRNFKALVIYYPSFWWFIYFPL